jgi:hypothetical protein
MIGEENPRRVRENREIAVVTKSERSQEDRKLLPRIENVTALPEMSSRLGCEFVGQLSPEIGQHTRVVGLPVAVRRQVQVT